MFLIRQRSNNNSLVSSGSGSLDSLSMMQGPRMRRRTREVGRLNPDLYRKMSLSSSSNTSAFGDIRLSYTWIGQKYDQLKIRILKIKNIPVEYYRAGLYIRCRFSVRTKTPLIYDFSFLQGFNVFLRRQSHHLFSPAPSMGRRKDITMMILSSRSVN